MMEIKIRMSDQNSMSHFLFLAANALSHPRILMVSLPKNISSTKIYISKSKIRERRGWGKTLTVQNKT